MPASPALIRDRLSPRDRAIIELMRRLHGGDRCDFGEALRALQEAVEAIIPAGRTYPLAWISPQMPVIGSLISRTGITQLSSGEIVVVQVGADRTSTFIEELFS